MTHVYVNKLDRSLPDNFFLKLMTEPLSEAMVAYWDLGPVNDILEYVDKNDNLSKRTVNAVWKIVGILSLS